MADGQATTPEAEAPAPEAQRAPFLGRTAWARNLAAPVRDFLSTETGSAAVLLAAAVVALVWANSPWSHSYESVWRTTLSIRLGGGSLSTDLRHWINEGVMTFFFLVVGLEAKREFDVGELRERRRLAIPVLAAAGGMAIPVAIYGAFNAAGPGAHGWGAAMSTDTAFALGALALLTPRAATRLRVFLLTLAVVDDLFALIVIATVYTSHVSLPALAAAIGLAAALLALRYAPEWRRQASIVLGVALWVALFKSGIDPVIAGLAVGLATGAYPPAREDLERATALTRSFREQPTAELARSAQLGVRAPWIAPRPALHGPRPSLSWASIVGGGAVAGIGFTVSLLISSLAFTGHRLQEAKLGVLASALVAPLVAWCVFAVYRRLPRQLIARQIVATAEDIPDLAEDVDPKRDHIRGPDDAPVTLVEYGDFECPYCGQAESVIRELLASFGDDVRYVWRDLPLNDVHPRAQIAAEASEAAAAQGKFWEMHDTLLAHQDALTPPDLGR